MNKNGKNYGKFFEDLLNFLKNLLLYKKNINSKYIDVDVEKVAIIADLYDNLEICMIIDDVNLLIDRLKNVTNQKVVVVTSFLRIMCKINLDDNEVLVDNPIPLKKNLDKLINVSEKSTNEFTNSEKIDNSKLTVNVKNSDDVEKINSNEFLDVNKDIIVNNSFALADKNLKLTLQKSMEKLPDFLTDNKFSVIVGSFMDTRLEVAGHGYLIFSGRNAAVTNKIVNNYELSLDFMRKVFGDDYYFVVITIDEWNSYRNEYINNYKNNVNYVVKNLINTEKKQYNDEKGPTDIDKLFDLVGEDSVEFR